MILFWTTLKTASLIIIRVQKNSSGIVIVKDLGYYHVCADHCPKLWLAKRFYYLLTFIRPLLQMPHIAADVTTKGYSIKWIKYSLPIPGLFRRGHQRFSEWHLQTRYPQAWFLSWGQILNFRLWNCFWRSSLRMAR